MSTVDATRPDPLKGVKRGYKTGGRVKGTPNKATADVKAIAQQFGPDALRRLAHLMQHAESEAAQVGACREILDRAYGKAPQAITGDPNMPISISIMTAVPRFDDKDD